MFENLPLFNFCLLEFSYFGLRLIELLAQIGNIIFGLLDLIFEALYFPFKLLEVLLLFLFAVTLTPHFFAQWAQPSRHAVQSALGFLGSLDGIGQLPVVAQAKGGSSVIAFTPMGFPVPGNRAIVVVIEIIEGHRIPESFGNLCARIFCSLRRHWPR